MQRALKNVLEIGAVRKCKESKGQFISGIFLVPKSNGEMRLILNLKKLNDFIETTHFKMEDIRTAMRLISEGSFMSNLDLQNAYFTIPIHSEHRKFLRFRWRHDLFEFVCLPFGLCTAPWVFTKVLKPVVGFLRSQGWLSVIYLDDILVLAESKKRCQENLVATKSLIESLGFMCNLDKSCLTPSTSCQFLGFILNSVDMTLELTQRKRENILAMIAKMENSSRCSIREFASFVGNLTAACTGVAYGWVHVKPLERVKYLALNEFGGDYDADMAITESVKQNLEWWREKILVTKNPIRKLTYSLTIFSDASLSGWGAFCNGEVIYGHWSPEESSLHINHLELLAAFHGLKSFANHYKSGEILLKIDNSTAIAYINKMGGIRFPGLSKLAADIWSWCEERRLWVFATYIPSRDNTEADMASRVEKIDIEWVLSPTAFNTITRQFGYPDIDLFASSRNTKCEAFCSWHKDPHAVCIDAFSLDWGSLHFYAFPPFSLILKTLKKIQNDQACGVVVVPDWCAQPWYPLWLSLLEMPPVRLQPSRDLLLSPDRKTQHPLADKLALLAGRLSGRLTKDLG